MKVMGTQMTIERGQDWGGPAPVGGVDHFASSDIELRGIVETNWMNQTPIPVVGLTGGDLWRALGAPVGGDRRLRGKEARQVSIDVMEVHLGEQRHMAVAHIFFLTSWWQGPVTAVMNSEWRGRWRVAPKAHPNDGWLDFLAGDLPIRQRLLMRQRLITGDHLPNSAITSRRIKEFSQEFSRPTRAILDGVDEGRHDAVSLKVLPDALTVIY